MSVLKRTVIVIPFAALVTLLLLLLMATLVTFSDDGSLREKRVVLPNIFMPDVEIETRRLIEKPEKPKVSEEPQPPVSTQRMALSQNTDLDLALTPPDQINTSMDLSIGLGLKTSDGEYLPIMKMAPEYPSRAARRGIEGYVVLEYTVTQQGAVKDITVVESEPSTIFNRAATRSAKGYKYQPRVENGKAVEVPGVRTKIVFRLEK